MKRFTMGPGRARELANTAKREEQPEKPKGGVTELVFILDRSGSMCGLERDTIGGFNAMLEKQKKLQDACRITTVLFDTQIEILHDRIDIGAVNPMTDREYRVGGCTALLDAIGMTIHKIGNVQRNTAKDCRAEKVIFVIITDGAENSSREYTAEKVKAQIQQQKAKYDWEFIFLGANIDAVETASHFGIDASRAQNYHADHEGVEVNFRAMSDAVASFRTCATVPESWSEAIEEDYKSRKGEK